MPINQSLRRARIVTRRVTTGLIKHAAPAADTLDAELTAEGEEPMNQREQMMKLAALTQKRFDAYNEEQSNLDKDEQETTTARGGRDDTATLLKKTLSQTSAAIRATYGARAVKDAKLSGTVPVVPETLLSFAQGFLDATGDDFTLPEPTNPFATVDLPAARARIDGLRGALSDALDTVTSELRDDQKVRNHRNDRYNTWEREVRFARDQARAILVRAGQKELADRLLPTDNQILGFDEIEDDDGP